MDEFKYIVTFEIIVVGAVVVRKLHKTLVLCFMLIFRVNLFKVGVCLHQRGHSVTQDVDAKYGVENIILILLYSLLQCRQF